MILVVIGIVPAVVVENGLVNSYEDRAVSLRTFNVKSQCDILCNRLVSENYFEAQGDTTTESELSLISNIYSGRILIVNQDYQIIFDTYDLDEGKIILSEEVARCFDGEDITNYDDKNQFIEIATPIQSNDQDRTVLGVMLVSVSTDEIVVSINILENKGILLLVIITLLVLIFGFVMSGILMKPFARITKAIDGISDGFLDDDLSVMDYTETEKISVAFNKMMERVRRLDESRQEFVSNVSHELKTPLASMKVLADSLNMQQDAPIEMYQEFMQDITEEIDRENKIITDLLSLVKLDKKAADLNISMINVNNLLELTLKRLKPIAAKRNIELILDSFRPVNAEVDEVKLTLAFSNLIENAIKYNKENGWVRVSLNADHKYFYVTVADSGIGIPEDSLDDIFERFYRVDKSHSREIGGTGLGLAITRNAIMMHHGVVKVYSKEDEGTTFSVRVPLTYYE